MSHPVHRRSILGKLPVAPGTVRQAAGAFCLLAAFGAGLGAAATPAKTATSSPAPPAVDSRLQRAEYFRDLLVMGQWVVLIPKAQGYELQISLQPPTGRHYTPEQELNLRYARSQQEMAEALYARAAEANRHEPYAVSQSDIAQLRFNQERTSLQYQQTVLQYDVEPYRIFAVGADYVGLRRGDTERLLPLGVILAIVRKTVAAPSVSAGAAQGR